MTNIDYDSVNREVAHYERRRDEIIVIEVLYDEVMTVSMFLLLPEC